MSVSEERYVFECEWFDNQASLIRNYLLTYYPKDQTVDMVSSFHLTSSLTLIVAIVRFEEPPYVFEKNGLP